MPYFITIYIHPMQGNIPHAFLGLTRKHPDKLDSDGLIEIDKYSDLQYDLLIGYYFNSIKKDKGEWYENIYPSILSDDFQGEGFFGFAPVESDVSHWGRVFENNQYAPKGNKIVSEFVEPYYYDRRSPSTFNKSNRCVFEVSQEQYKFLLDEIKKEVTQTSNRNPNLQQDNSKMASLESLKQNLYYNSIPLRWAGNIETLPLHNCTTWVLHKNEMKCMHGGVVQLKSNLGKSIQDKNIPFILETDLLYSSIVGCPNPPISGGHCTQVVSILPHSRGLKKHNEDYPIMQDLVSSGVFSDKGVPLICTPKPNSYKINAPSPTHTKNIEKEALKNFKYNQSITHYHWRKNAA